MKIKKLLYRFALILVLFIISCTSALPNEAPPVLNTQDIDNVIHFLVYIIENQKYESTIQLASENGVSVLSERWGGELVSPGYNNDEELISTLQDITKSTSSLCLGYILTLNGLPDKVSVFFTNSSIQWEDTEQYFEQEPLLTFSLFKRESGWELVSVSLRPKYQSNNSFSKCPE